IERFVIDIPQDVLDDLAVRLADTRWPDEIPGTGWDYGTDLSYLRELVEYWRTEYDWRAQERALNELEHFRAIVGGLGVHFIHERGKGPDPFPLVISHGWPGSVVEMLRIIPMLTDPASHGGDPADSFDVVVPSLPGYGFSDKPVDRGMSNRRIAGMWHTLMTEGLGYARFGAQGGDWGGMISSRLGFDFPQSVAGVHLNLMTGVPAFRGAPDPPLTEAEQEFVRQARRWFEDEGGYFHIQRTKPQTLGSRSTTRRWDWPRGSSKSFAHGRTAAGNPENSYTRDELLTNIMVYWVGQSGASSVRHYYENRVDNWRFQPGERVEVPCAVALFPVEINRPPREWAERTHNVQRWTKMPRGGHFAAMEQPELLSEDVRAFFRTIRQHRSSQGARS
ncbi:Putative epoxide hydrolase, partial [Geodia barretti]